MTQRRCCCCCLCFFPPPRWVLPCCLLLATTTTSLAMVEEDAPPPALAFVGESGGSAMTEETAQQGSSVCVLAVVARGGLAVNATAIASAATSLRATATRRGNSRPIHDARAAASSVGSTSLRRRTAAAARAAAESILRSTANAVSGAHQSTATSVRITPCSSIDCVVSCHFFLVGVACVHKVAGGISTTAAEAEEEEEVAGRARPDVGLRRMLRWSRPLGTGLSHSTP